MLYVPSRFAAGSFLFGQLIRWGSIPINLIITNRITVLAAAITRVFLNGVDTAILLSNIETGTTRVSLNTIITIANVLSVTSDDLLCDNIIMAKAQFEIDIALLLEDCDEYEIRIIKDMVASLKDTLRRDKHLRMMSSKETKS